MKGKKGTQNTDLAQKHSDNTQFLSFLHDDFLSKPSSKEARAKIVIEAKELLTHTCAQYKALLELPPLAFWSTMQHNLYLNRSLDSFLAFARRWHFSILDLSRSKDNVEYQDDLDYETINIKKHLYLYFNELYRVVLSVYDRLSSDPLDTSIKHKIPYSEVIYQNWLFDVPKFLDICALYYDCDGERVKKILQNVFKVEDAYQDDFLDFIGDLVDNIIPNNLKIINRHRKREDLDAQTLNSDTEEKERVLIVLYDVIYHLKLACLCFPKGCVEGMYYNKKFLLTLENTYMVLNSCSKSWRVNADKESILSGLVRRINNTIFRVFERVINSVFGSILLTNSGDKISKDKKLWGGVNDFLNQTGKTMLKKKEDDPNHKFLRKLMRYVDFGAILQKVPAGVLKEEDIETHLVLLMVLREKTDMLKKKYAPAEEKEEAHVQQNESPEKAPVATPVQANPVKEVKLEKKPSVIDKEAESTKEAIRIIEMSMGKKNKKLNIFDEDEVRGAMEATLKLAASTNVYDDEYDDTLEMYEEDRLRVAGDKADENEDDDDENVVEGAVKPEEGGKQGARPRGKRGGYQEKGGKGEGQKGGRPYEERGKGGYDNKDKQQGGQKYEEERGGQEGYKYQSNKYGEDRGGYKGQGDRYQGDKYQQKGGNYQGDRYQGGDKYQGGDRYQQKGGNYQGERYQGQGGDRYQGNKYEDNRGGQQGGQGGYKGGYNKNEKVYQEKGGKDSFEEERDEGGKRDTAYKGPEKSRDGGFAMGGGGGFDQKKQNRSTYNERQKYKGGTGNRNEKEFVPKK